MALTGWSVVAALFAVGSGCTKQQARVLRVATTSSTVDSGLFDKLVPVFEGKNAARVDVIATGTGKALKLGERGDVDVVFVHSRAAEDRFMAAGHGIRRKDVMFNNFEILGPPEDPARIKGVEPVSALARIARGRHRFVSRGDGSGTHTRETALWNRASLDPQWKAYTESGRTMGATLIMADQMRSYVLADRGTYLRFKRKVRLIPLAKVTKLLHNPYGIIVINPAKNATLDGRLANAFVDFFVTPSTQLMIREFRVGGERLFHPMGENGDGASQ